MYKIVITTTNDLQVADKIKDCILNDKLSPCVQVINNIQSGYIWKSRVENSEEYMLLIKCKDSKVNDIKSIIEKYQKYDVYELISLDMEIINLFVKIF